MLSDEHHSSATGRKHKKLRLSTDCHRGRKTIQSRTVATSGSTATWDKIKLAKTHESEASFVDEVCMSSNLQRSTACITRNMQ